MAQRGPMRVVIIGGGSSGLVTLKTLLQYMGTEHAKELEVVLFESESEIGGTFRYRVWENAEHVSSRQLTLFSDFRLPANSPDHLPIPQYIQYLHDYCDKFGLWPYIRLSTIVTRVNRIENKQGPWCHRVEYRTCTEKGDKVHILECSHLVICSGLHVEPNIPKIPGIEYTPEFIHSSQYKARSQVIDKHVLILGCQETAHDISYESLKAGAKSVTMAFRDGFLYFPKILNRLYFFGLEIDWVLPIDSFNSNLFETTYVHPKLEASRARWFFAAWIMGPIEWFLTGTSSEGGGIDQHIGLVASEQRSRASTIHCKTPRAMAYLNRPWKKKTLSILDKIGNIYADAPEDANSADVINTATWPRRILSNGVVEFTPDPDRPDYARIQALGPIKPDIIIAGTGYTHSFPFLTPKEYPAARDASIRDIVAPGHPDVAFIGFVRPGVGAIPPMAEMQALWWTALITGRMELPTTLGHYHLQQPRGARVQYGVDHITYVATLARDFGGVPGLWTLWSEYGTKVLLCYCLGTAYNSFYRLVGPFRSEAAADVVRGELWQLVMRRGRVYTIFFSLIPMAFWGFVNMLCCLLDPLGLLPSTKSMEETMAEVNGQLTNKKKLLDNQVMVLLR